MLDDIGSWDVDCIRLVAEIRAALVELAGGGDLTCTLLQGSGSYAVESMIGSAVPRDGKLLILKNGAYGLRMRLIAEALGVRHAVLEEPENVPHDPAALDAALAADPGITHVACVHCETTTGVLNPLRELGLVAARHRRRFLADAVSSFGAYPVGAGRDIDFAAGPIDHLVSTANKCIEGVPGFAFIISRRAAIEECAGRARSLALDLHAQWSQFEQSGKFRFTPPTHVLLAFRQALRELAAEGGVEARARRYHESHRVLIEGMARLGFEPYVAPGCRSHIITTFRYPQGGFDFQRFYDHLHARGFIIYPGKLTGIDTFRIANIGSIGRREVEALLEAIAAVGGEAEGGISSSR
jgi:2-aminoethylphosphonate-pyruvate transaminase